MYSAHDIRFFIVWVSPFGYLRIYAYLQLPAAFRSLSRPSSAPSAKAFTLCSFSLEQLSCLFFYISFEFCLSLSFSNCLGLFIFSTFERIISARWQNCRFKQIGFLPSVSHDFMLTFVNIRKTFLLLRFTMLSHHNLPL